jgi:hypothetical protein
MKNKLLSSFRCPIAAPRFLLGCALLLGASASAQLLKNGDFESPLDPWDPAGLSGGQTNWTLVYASGGPGDFALHERTAQASRHEPNGNGAQLRPKTDFWCGAYFKQTVSNLTPGNSYVVSGYINTLWSSPKLDVYIETVGGSTVRSPTAATKWNLYSVTNTASSGGTLEVRLRLDKQPTVWCPAVGQEKYWTTDAMFDDFTMTAQ